MKIGNLGNRQRCKAGPHKLFTHLDPNLAETIDQPEWLRKGDLVPLLGYKIPLETPEVRDFLLLPSSPLS
jgi:hypothetical protein